MCFIRAFQRVKQIGAMLLAEFITWTLNFFEIRPHENWTAPA